VRSAVLGAPLIVGSVGDGWLLRHVFEEYRIDTVLHFAAHTIVPESVAEPLRYYANNTLATQRLLESCSDAGVRHFVFSSSAAVYGNPACGVVAEDAPTLPINPYGTSKLMSEWMLRDLAATGAMRYVALRYFNVAGCDPFRRIGQSTRNATLLIKVACEVAAGQRAALHVYGTDYPTPDGTGVRDYIHVEDLANAHVRAVGHLREGGPSLTLNCGYGHGHSVREVIQAVERAAGCTLPVTEGPRRSGDPAVLIADARRIGPELGWVPRFDDLDFIVRTSLDWERRHVFAVA
jgi:UDP-glucose 4-epimerase